MKQIVVKIKNVFLYSMEDQVPTALSYDGHIYRIDRNAKPESKTEELNNMMREKHPTNENEELDPGEIVVRTGNGTIIHRNPLNEIIELKEKGHLTNLNIAKILRKYNRNLRPTTISIYRTGYKNYVNKAKNEDFRSNEPPKTHETVTDKDRNLVIKTLQEIREGNSDVILKYLDMTEYKLKLILSDEKTFERSGEIGKEMYKLREA